ncbi:MAG: hypothetical protein QOD14_2367 [Solirubrobacterales bacterium]|jgi:hypothetical protein|nr:hypothetical protein [Solirubrobacterales bacterium]
MTRRAPLILACAAVLAGCGGGGGSDQQSASDAVNSYVGAENHQNFQQVCELLSDQLRRQLGGGNCARFVDEQTSGNPHRQLKVIGVTASGDHATAQLQTTGESGTPINLKISLDRQNGKWQVTSLGGGRG